MGAFDSVFGGQRAPSLCFRWLVWSFYSPSKASDKKPQETALPTKVTAKPERATTSMRRFRRSW